jgi:hypothetical protein
MLSATRVLSKAYANSHACKYHTPPPQQTFKYVLNALLLLFDVVRAVVKLRGPINTSRTV